MTFRVDKAGLAALVLIALVLGAAALLQGGPLPGDVGFTATAQALLGDRPPGRAC